MATGSFPNHWISFLYLNIKCSSLKSHFAVINEKLGPFFWVRELGIKGSRTSRSYIYFIPAGWSLQLSKYLSVKSSYPFKCTKFRVACFCDFSHRREVQLGAPLLYTPQFLYVTERFVDEHVISLRTCSCFRLSILCALYIIPTDGDC